VLLLVLWVRSYFGGDYFSAQLFNIAASTGSNRGEILAYDVSLLPISNSGFHVTFIDAAEFYLSIHWTDAESLKLTPSHWPIRASGQGSVLVSHWLLVVATGVLAALPWIRYRFSLRALLVATTLIAVVMGLAVWAVGGGK